MQIPFFALKVFENSCEEIYHIVFINYHLANKLMDTNVPLELHSKYLFKNIWIFLFKIIIFYIFRLFWYTDIKNNF
jgi:hypothetical protein